MQIEGRNTVLELLRSGKEVKRIFLQEFINQDTKINAIVKKARKQKIPIIRKNKKELDRTSQTGAHQGVIAFSHESNNISLNDLIERKLANNQDIRIVYIREAFHDHNIGAIIRTAECAGFDAVILPPKIPMTANIIRASTGASEHINIFNEALFPLLKECRKQGIKTIGIERTDSSKIYTETDLTGSVMLIIGGEDKTLSSEVLEKCDEAVIIPMNGKVNSLNMSVATAVVIFEVMRQNDFDG